MKHPNNIRPLEVCLNQVIGACPNCQRDLNSNHHPNNRDCKDYKPIYLEVYEVGRYSRRRK